MVERSYEFVELDEEKVLGLPELLSLEHYHREEGPWRVVLYSVSYRGCRDGYALFHLFANYYDEKSLPHEGLLHLLKSVDEEGGYYSFHYLVPIRIPVEYLKERLKAYGFSLQSLDIRFAELVVILKKAWTDPLTDIEVVGLNVWYKDLFGKPMPEDF